MDFLLGVFISLSQIISGSVASVAQEIQEYPLDPKLNEISGLELLNDSTLIAFNDGGNEAILYLLNLEGEIQKEVALIDIKNRDWEDITIDDEFVYLGDIGNNNNDRENLAIIKLGKNEILTKDAVEGEKIKFSYQEQSTFPPDQASLFFDAEAMVVHNDSIWIFTKDRSIPYQGLSLVYKLPLEPGKYKVSASYRINLGKGGWWSDSVTAADFFDGKFYVLTYNRYIVFELANDALKMISEHELDRMAQRESIVVLNKQTIFVADEQSPIAGDVRLYKISLP